MKSQVLNITGGFYTAVVVKFELFESSIIDERYFATREEAEAQYALPSAFKKIWAEGLKQMK